MAVKFLFCRPPGIVRNPTSHLTLVIACTVFVVISLYVLGRITNSESVSQLTRPGQSQRLLRNAIEDEEKLVLLIAVLSSVSVEGAQRRNAVRSSWMRLLPSRAEVLFFVGGQGLDPELEESIHESVRTQSDLVMLPDVQDGYAALTDKLLGTAAWAREHRHFKYMLKCDDDTFLRPEVIVPELAERSPSSPPLYWGFFDGRHAPRQQGQWAEKSYVLCDRYIPYAKGGAYVLSASLVAYVAQNRELLVRFNSEDVSLGSWLAAVAVERRHDPRFDTEYVSRGCDNRFVAMHKQTTGMLLQSYSNLVNTGAQCSRETRTRGSYIYDWKVPPSKCCKRASSRDRSVP